MRIPLTVNLESRAGGLDKDSRLINCFAEAKREGDLRVIKRPGLSQKFDLTSGNGNGMFCWGGTFYSAKGATLAQGPTVDPVADGTAWSNLSNPPQTNTTQTCVAGSYLYIFEWYSGARNVWRTTDGVNFSVVTAAATGISGSDDMPVIYLGGTFYLFRTSNNDILSSSDGITWSVIGTGPWGGTGYSGWSIVVWNNEIWAIGGISGSTYYDEVYKTANGVSWSTVTGAPGFSVRRNAGIAVLNNVLYIAGGQTTGGTYLNDVWYSSNGSAWTQQTASAAWSARKGSKMLSSHGGKLFIVGGENAGILTDCYKNTSGTTWTEKSSNIGASSYLYHTENFMDTMCAVSNTAFMKADINAPGGETYTIEDLPTNYTNTSGAASSQYLVIKNAQTAWVLTAGNPGTLTEITDGDYPAATVDGIVYLDGYFFVMDADGVIYNSDLEDPTSWNSLNFITAESAPDAGVAIAKHQNYVVALKSTTVELFYDAANPTASPLSVLSNTPLQIGCANGKSVVGMDGCLFFMSQTGSYGPSVHLFNTDSLTPIEIATADVKRILAASSLTTVRSFGMRMSGHTFYVLNLLSDGVSLVYDFNMKHWATWTYREVASPITLTSVTQTGGVATATKPAHGFEDGDVITIAGATPSGYNGTFNITKTGADTFTFEVSSALSSPATGTITATGTTETHFPFSAFQSCGGVDYIQHEDSGIIYEISDTHLNDDGQYIDVHITTPMLDLGSAKRKPCGQIEIIGDKVNADALVRYTDDDHATYSKYRKVDLGINRSRIHRNGSFNRRSFEIRITDDVAINLSSIELEGI